MRDFPVFTTENGVGSIVLKEIPYSGVAYVTIRDSAAQKDFLSECVEFCRAVGAQRIFATGDALECYPFYMSVIRMSASYDILPATDACLFPVTESTLARFREIYNNKMKHVDNVAFMSERVASEMLKRGDGYFVHRDGKLLGIGMAAEDQIACVVSVERGAGREVVCALKHALMCECIVLEVASTNHKAISLYESLGFLKTEEISKWYKIY